MRCSCGAFVREDGLEKHYQRCRWVEAENQAEYDVLSNHLLSEAMV